MTCGKHETEEDGNTTQTLQFFQWTCKKKHRSTFESYILLIMFICHQHRYRTLREKFTT